MTSQVIFRLDSALKEQAMEKADREGISFSTILKLAVKSYVDDALVVDLSPKFNPKTERMLRRELREAREGKGLSPRFTDAKSAMAYLRSVSSNDERPVQKKIRKRVRPTTRKNTR